LYYGVPLLVVPQMSEQALVGRRVEELGAALYCAKEEVTPEALRTAAGRLLAEAKFRQQAAAIGDSFRSAGGIMQAAGAIRRYSKTGASARAGNYYA